MHGFLPRVEATARSDGLFDVPRRETLLSVPPLIAVRAVLCFLEALTDIEQRD